MMTSTDEAPGLSARPQQWPWTSAQVDGLPPEEKAALGLLLQFDRQQGGSASVPIQIGLALNLLDDRETYTKLGLADMDEVCQAFRSIGARQGRDYQRAARRFTLKQVGDTRHSLAGLLEISATPVAKYRQALLEQGSGRTVGELREARQAAEACGSTQEGLAALAAKLVEKRTPLEVEFRRISSAGPYLVRRARRLTELEQREGQGLDEERKEDLIEKAEGWIAAMQGLVAALKGPPPGPAAPDGGDGQEAAADGDGAGGEELDYAEYRVEGVEGAYARAADSDDRAADSDDRAADSDDRTADSDDRAADSDPASRLKTPSHRKKRPSQDSPRRSPGQKELENRSFHVSHPEFYVRHPEIYVLPAPPAPPPAPPAPPPAPPAPPPAPPAPRGPDPYVGEEPAGPPSLRPCLLQPGSKNPAPPPMDRYMKEARSPKIQFVLQALEAIRREIGADITLTPAERRARRGEWFKHARRYGQDSALYRDGLARHLPNIPYDGAEILVDFDDAQEAETLVFLFLQELRRYQDLLLHRRGKALGKAHGVRRSMEARLKDPFLDEQVRAKLTGSLQLLRAQHDRRNQKVSQAKLKAAAARPTRPARAKAAAPQPEIIDAVVIDPKPIDE